MSRWAPAALSRLLEEASRRRNTSYRACMAARGPVQLSHLQGLLRPECCSTHACGSPPCSSWPAIGAAQTSSSAVCPAMSALRLICSAPTTTCGCVVLLGSVLACMRCGAPPRRSCWAYHQLQDVSRTAPAASPSRPSIAVIFWRSCSRLLCVE